MKHKLSIFEGLPGSGKSTLAAKVHEYLVKQGVEARFHFEGDLDHPADYESTACLTEREYGQMMANHADHREVISQYTVKKGEDYFISFGKIRRAEKLKDLTNSLSRYSTYGNLPWEKEKRIMLDYWREFAGNAVVDDRYTIFECCFLQNQMCELMARFDKSEKDIYKQISGIAKIISKLDPLIVYLEIGDIPKRMKEVVPERPKEWLDFVIDYHTNQGYGLANGLKGYDGLLAFYEERQRREKDMLDGIYRDSLSDVLIIKDAYKDWDGSFNKVLNKIRQKI